jgi:hypothetical protein
MIRGKYLPRAFNGYAPYITIGARSIPFEDFY